MTVPSTDILSPREIDVISGDDTLVALATYNERDNLPNLLPEILRELPNAGVLIIDDNSPDGTGTWAEDLKSREPRVEVVHRKAKEGLGTAYLVAMAFAREQQFTWLITMDADGSHSPSALTAMLRRATSRPSCDVVIGSRYVPGGSIINWPWQRRMASAWLNWVLRRTLRAGITDYTSGFRCYRVSRLDPSVTLPSDATGFGFLEELIVRLQGTGASFAEIPITFMNRTLGSSKATWHECWTAARGILKLIRNTDRRQVPQQSSASSQDNA
jgi:dolichol-phosphate mannosyltransferase